MKPKRCKKLYIPWFCGTCKQKQECKPSTPARYERGKVRA